MDRQGAYKQFDTTHTRRDNPRSKGKLPKGPKEVALKGQQSKQVFPLSKKVYI